MDQYYSGTDSYSEYPVIKSKPILFYKNSSKKLRILITTFWNYPFVGGLQNYIKSLKKGLEKLGHHVDVIAPNQFSKSETSILRKKIAHYYKQYFINRYGSFSDKILKNLCDLVLYEMMLRKINLNQYDIFHAQDRFTANVLGRLNQNYQKPLLFTPHGFMTHTRLKFNLIKKGSIEEVYFSAVDRQAIKNSNHSIILSHVFRPILNSLGAADEKMTTVYTGIEFAGNKIKKENYYQNDKIIITCVSRLRPRKGHKYLFEALSYIKSQLNNVEVRIVGDGEMKNELETQVQELQLDNVYFLGSRNDIAELLNDSDIFVLPTTSDTVPISIIEAMFAQQAILTTDCGGIPEIIQDQYSGIIVEPANSEELAEKLLLLVTDWTLREKLAENAKNVAEKNLTAINMSKKIERIYLSLISQEEKG
ncbi:glycosyltransferase family 4 protein [Neobacillus sp. LXY-4]